MRDPLKPRIGRGVILLRSTGDGVVLGAAAGVVYALMIGLGALVEPLLSAGSAPGASGFSGLVAVAIVVTVPVGSVLGAVFGTGFGIAAASGVRHLAGIEAAVVAVFGGVVLTAAITGSEHVTSGVLAWTIGPLVAGVPAAAWHGRRSQRRVSRRRP
ncbi:hypothetical protein OOZ19_10270 [Saccharopolyspora sp. NFXS83]|uniref:hypothetical protein n=1 Tax=Saccharopolyspora sp. NFXS83 TaxID=2993560 RepID=UPI00224B2336|nr:hypothetical protein [Saccharopolyspora sp. NFXS83]MCX2730627.1 hypothetical protein [Saccharopolyspora sp. NFXS83]